MLTHAPMPVFNAFAPAGRGFTYATIPGALPRAVCLLGFQPAYGNDGVSLQISENPKLYAVFQIPEGGILRSKRPPFSLQYATFWSAKGGLLHFKRYHLDFQYVNVSPVSLSFLLYHKPPLPLLWKRRGHSAGTVCRSL